MPRHPGLPKPVATQLSRTLLLDTLKKIDSLPESRDRILAMETDFRKRIDDHVASLPEASATFHEFSTNPFVLLIHTRQKHYSKISELEKDILPAKTFSSMETSAGRMVERVVLPHYGWECVPSQMHTPYSAIDGKCMREGRLLAATLKSGPRCLSDPISEDLALAVVENGQQWAMDSHSLALDFTYGALYGTKKQSNKKDWHILRNIAERTSGNITSSHNNAWSLELVDGEISVTATVRIGVEWWEYLGGPLCFVEVMTALIRACVSIGPADAAVQGYSISDLGAIVSTQGISEAYNVSLLQKSQLPWFFLMASHFCDELID